MGCVYWIGKVNSAGAGAGSGQEHGWEQGQEQEWSSESRRGRRRARSRGKSSELMNLELFSNYLDESLTFAKQV